jgi:glycosyltransferase involved in cell wall biosynthesis
MKVLFLTLSRITDINKRGIYTDLIRKFSNNGHEIFVVSPFERRYGEPTQLIEFPKVKLLKIKTFNIQKTNVIEKGIGTVLLEYQYLNGIKKFFKDIKFDLIIYSTPPITLTKVITYFKRKSKAKTYLLLKDIFPQNAVDLGLLRRNGFLHRLFRSREKELYALSDYIGCMSPANVAYLLKHNPEIDPDIVEVNPNSTEPVPDSQISIEEKAAIRIAHNIPTDKIVFIYGGNLGKPQGIDFLIETLNSNRNNNKVFFIVIGSGTEFPKIKQWYQIQKPVNVIVLDSLPKEQYDNLVKSCDVGMIFLDHRFTIPNFPSRLLSYIEIKKPIIAATDMNTDIGEIAELNGFGLCCQSGDLEQMNRNIERLTTDNKLIEEMGENGYRFYLENFTSTHSYAKIINHF